MPSKELIIDGIGKVTVSKLRRSKHLRISVKADGTVKISIPMWASYKHAEEFVRQKQEWLLTKIEPVVVLENNVRIGKGQRLKFIPSSKHTSVRTRINGGDILVTFPENLNPTDPSVQSAAQKACIKSLKIQSEELLPHRLRTLAERHDFHYNSVQIRQLKGRWGSCSSKKDITLSSYLIQLDWHEIDYVLLHELTHTEFMSHNSDFWGRLVQVLPDAKAIRKIVSHRKPIIVAAS